MPFDPLLLVYAVPLIGLWAIWIANDKRRSKRNIAVVEEARAAGLIEPASLHPVIDPALCLGCGACVAACPEKSILGLVDGKARLLEPTECVGHGACQEACPTDAIQLVFGTETRGVEIPMLSATFETSAQGIFIAGELGGMGLIRNAIEQGRQCIQGIALKVSGSERRADVLDVLIVGAGPAGIAASLGALERGLAFRTIEQYNLGGTVAHFPRGKLVMTAPAELPIVGKVKFSEVSKERLLEFWQGVVQETGLQIAYGERVTGIDREDDLFRISTTKDSYLSKTVLLAIGRRGTPRMLDVPGEELPKTVYRLIDPEQYQGQRVLVVGGGDSALEAAATIVEAGGAEVTLSYRGDAFPRARLKNRNRVEALDRERRLDLILGSEVERIEPDRVVLRTKSGTVDLANDTVIVCAGGVLPTQLLKDSGVDVATKFGTL